MIQKITSKKVDLPPIYLVENEEDFKALPKGIPYIIGNKSELRFITIFLEFQILYKSCLKTGLPIKWLECLRRLGYGENLKEYILSSGGEFWTDGGGAYALSIDDFVQDQYIVNFDRLSELKILPVWLDDIRSSIEMNIIDEVVFDPTAFNKQLGLNVGYGAVKNGMKNLLILDVSGSIPRGVVVTITNLAKLMSKKFYADVMITSGKTVLIDYDHVPESDIIKIAQDSGSGNEGIMYKEIVEKYKEYNTVICFGDDDCPVRFSKGSGSGELVPKFKINTLYSLHTNSSTENITGYSKYLKAKTTHIVKDWVNTIK